MFKTFLVTILDENFADIGNGNSCLVFAKVLLSLGQLDMFDIVIYD